MSEECEVCNIRKVSFNSLNYSVTTESSYKEDTLKILKQIALDILKDIQEK